MMDLRRRDFLKGSLATLALGAVDGLPVFAAPPGWRPPKRANLVVGILSDTHLQSGHDGITPHGGFPLTYVTNAMKYFAERDIDAFMHLGDGAHRGKNCEIQYHRDIFERFFPGGKSARTGRNVEKLLVVGNHELYGNDVGGAGAWGPNVWPDPVERAKHVLVGDLPRYWEMTWGEKFSPVWHKEVNGYHFFGRHWETKEEDLANFILSKADEYSLKGVKPFFILSHKRHHFPFNHALRDFPNAVAFFGHWHQSNADWKTIYFDSFGGFFPSIQCGACRMDGSVALDGESQRVTKGDLVFERAVPQGTAWDVCRIPARQGLVMRVYEWAIVIERHEFGFGGKIGPDWIFPLGQYKPSPFSRATLTRKIGAPEFPGDAKLDISVGVSRIDTRPDKALVVYRPDAKKKEARVASPVSALSIAIPLANGNPRSPVYAYDVVVVGDNPKERLFKSIYWEGCSVSPEHAPFGGVTRLDIPMSELPSGSALTIAVRPLSSLGTKGAPLVVAYSTVSRSVRPLKKGA